MTGSVDRLLTTGLTGARRAIQIFRAQAGRRDGFSWFSWLTGTVLNLVARTVECVRPSIQTAASLLVPIPPADRRGRRINEFCGLGGAYV